MSEGESAEAYLQKVRQSTFRIRYGETQIRDKFLDSLPPKCRAAILMSAPDKMTSEDIATKAQLYIDIQEDDKTQAKELSFSNQHEIDKLREEIHSLSLQENDETRGRTSTRRPSTPRPTSTYWP